MMTVFRQWALVAVYYDTEADGPRRTCDQLTKNMSVMDWHCEGIANTMIQVQGRQRMNADEPKFQTITTEQS
jgi:hypothetical protein